MAWNKYVTLITILVVLLPTIAMAKEFVVGDDSGWKTNFDYEAWAKDKVFRVGDTLVFNYKAPNHNVFKLFITVSDESSAVRGITLSGSYQAFMAVIMAITAIAALST
ncbi:hypothetical protein L3X38_036296 [Prunus dulcis]|uniref:Phytocyanin domain-containing protein n=1 Tax=Prunus dulcis TaxID=3755 RepID=A0AAD4V184_PRUDU|nr:hypothetical protein L3X38_036296 [Prunus dulcis]